MLQSESKISHRNDHTFAEARAEILFLEQKYDRIKKKLYQKKLIGELKAEDLSELGNVMNMIAMKYSQEGQQTQAEDWLRRVLKHCPYCPRMSIITYNNLACVYRQSDNLPMALLYINKAQKEADMMCLENQDDNILKVVTDCSLNLCAILSSMGEHYRALKAIKKAVCLIKSTQKLPAPYRDALYPIAKYNEGVQYERLKMYNQARECYVEAAGSPGITHQLTLRITEALQTLKALKSQNQSRLMKRISVQKTIASRENSISHPSTGRASLNKKRKLSEQTMRKCGKQPTIQLTLQKMGERKRRSDRVLGCVENL